MVNNILAENVINVATLQTTATTPSVSIVMRSDTLWKPVLTRRIVVYARSHLIELIFVITLGSVNLLLLGRLFRTHLDRNRIADRNFSKNCLREIQRVSQPEQSLPLRDEPTNPPSAAAPSPEDSILDSQGLLILRQLFGDGDDFDLFVSESPDPVHPADHAHEVMPRPSMWRTVTLHVGRVPEVICRSEFVLMLKERFGSWKLLEVQFLPGLKAQLTFDSEEACVIIEKNTKSDIGGYPCQVVGGRGVRGGKMSSFSTLAMNWTMRPSKWPYSVLVRCTLCATSITRIPLFIPGRTLFT